MKYGILEKHWGAMHFAVNGHVDRDGHLAKVFWVQRIGHLWRHAARLFVLKICTRFSVVSKMSVCAQKNIEIRVQLLFIP